VTIKTKLTWNVIIVIVSVGAVAATSMIGMGFVKNRLLYLTERSTPFQMRTVEFQRAIQGTVADLMKVMASDSMDEYKTNRSGAEKSISDVKDAQAVLESMSGGTKIGTYEELHKIASELFKITEDRLRSEEDAVSASKAITKKLKEASDRLKDLDAKIRALQLNRTASFMTLIEESKDIESMRQSNALTQANIATNVLLGTTELVSMGASIDALSNRLLSANSVKEVDGINGEMQRTFDKIFPAIKTIERFLKKLNASEETQILAGVEGSLSSLRSHVSTLISRIRYQLNMKEKASQSAERLHRIALKQAQKGKETVTAAHGEQERAIGTVNRMVRFSTILVIAIGIGAFVFGITFGTWIYRSVARPLNELIWGAEQIAQGDLTCARAEYSNDEIGMVHRSMCRMIDNLRGIVGKMKTSTGTLASSSEELSATATSLEKGSHEQGMQIEQSAAAMTEMSQTTIDMARNASDTAEAAQKMKKAALQGRDAMHVTVQELQRFADTVRESAEKVESLGQKSREISNVITLIKEIADQTNLLALNAAIEAARAGEQGRGFAVVADNVRQLAERTTVATGDIADTVKAMQAEVSESVNFMKEERESVGKVLDHVNSTLRSIDEIVDYVEQVADMIQRIAAATEEQSSASEEVSHNMENIAGITRHLGSSIAEIKRASEDLSKLATELNSMAGWFKV